MATDHRVGHHTQQQQKNKALEGARTYDATVDVLGVDGADKPPLAEFPRHSFERMILR